MKVMSIERNSISNKTRGIPKNYKNQNLNGFYNFKNSRSPLAFKGKYFPSGFYTDEDIKLAKKYLNIENFLEPLTDEIWESYGNFDKIFHNKKTNESMNEKAKSIVKLMEDLKDEAAIKDMNTKKIKDDLENQKLENEGLRTKKIDLEKNLKTEKIKKKKEEIKLEIKKLDLEMESLKKYKETIKELKLSDYTNILKNEFVNLAQIEKKEKKSGKVTSKLLFPNGIMLVNLEDNINNELIQWLVRKSDCSFEKIDFGGLTEDEALTNIKNIAQKAKDEDKRTLIYIKNFDKFTTPKEENDAMLAKLKAFLSDCAEQYKCTVITNIKDPSKLAYEITAEQRFPVNISND